MPTSDRFLPASPPLPLSTFLDRRERAAGVFPFSEPNSRWYFLARNALYQGLQALQLDEGDEILVPAYNAGAEADAIVATGLSPRYFRIGLDLQPDLLDMQSRVSRRTRALLAIHYFGLPQPLAELTAFCARNALLLIEDCAPALFSRDRDGPLGTTGVFSIFSPRKTFPLPHGGILVANSDVFGPPDEPEPLPPSYGVDLLPRRLLDGLRMQSAAVRRVRRAFQQRANGSPLGLEGEQFDPSTANWGASAAVQRLALRFDPPRVVAARRRNYERLASLLPCEGQLVPELPRGVCPLAFPFLVSNRPEAIRALGSGGIELFPYWAEAHPSIPSYAFPEAEYLRQHVLALPVYQGLSRLDVEYLAKSVMAVTRAQ